MTESLTPVFRQQWQSMARTSWRMYQNLLGLAGRTGGVRRHVRPAGFPATARPAAPRERTDGKPSFAELERELTPEIGVRSVEVDPGTTPFAPRHVRRGSQLMFNLPAYSRMLLSDFRAAGGKVVIDELHTPADFARLPHRTLVNATGIGARTLMGDESVVPVRGQLVHMIPQSDVHYGLQYNRVGMTPRRDGFVLQVSGQDDYYGYGIATREPDMAEAELAVRTIASAFKPRPEECTWND